MKSRKNIFEKWKHEKLRVSINLAKQKNALVDFRTRALDRHQVDKWVAGQTYSMSVSINKLELSQWPWKGTILKALEWTLGRDYGARATRSKSGVDILISSRFCGPLCAEIFKLISAWSIFCDNFHFSKFSTESQGCCWKTQISIFSNFKFRFFSNWSAVYLKSAKFVFCVFQSFIFRPNLYPSS